MLVGIVVLLIFLSIWVHRLDIPDEFEIGYWSVLGVLALIFIVSRFVMVGA